MMKQLLTSYCTDLVHARQWRRPSATAAFSSEPEMPTSCFLWTMGPYATHSIPLYVASSDDLPDNVSVFFDIALRLPQQIHKL